MLDTECGAELVRAIYGHKHSCEEHTRQTFYKPRLLRKVVNGEVFAYPGGIPEGFDSVNRVHFIGHSLGAGTIMHLQYLLSIDYFSHNKLIDDGKAKISVREGHSDDFSTEFEPLTNLPLENKANYIASVTCLQGMINGSATNYGQKPSEYT